MRWIVCAWVLFGCGRIGFDDLGEGPAGRVELDFRDCGSLPSGVTFARSSPATYFDATGALQTAAPGQPRCSYDANGTPHGLLVEGASINYNTRARGDGTDIENLPLGWLSQHGANVTVNATATDSTTFLGMRDVTITMNNGAAAFDYWQVLIDSDVPQGGIYTLSWYVRSNDTSGIENGCYTFALLFTPNYAMQLGRSPESPTEMPTATWRRYVYTLDVPPQTGVFQMYFECTIRPSGSFTVTLAAPQLEPGPLATSPILTAGATATRAADVVTIPTALLDIDDTGTVIVDVDVAAEAVGARRVALASRDTADTTMFRLAHDSTGWNAYDGDSGAGVQRAAIGAHRVGYRFASDAGTFVLDGMTSVSLGARSLAGSITALGADRDGADSLSGTLERVRAWPDALDDATLVNVTR